MTAGSLIEISNADPNALVEAVEFRRARQPKSLVDLVMYLQSIIGGTPNSNVYRQLESTPLPPFYGLSTESRRNQSRDLARLKLEGIVAVQEIFTEVELDSMNTMLNMMRERQDELGRGAQSALNLFQAMLSCRIQDRCLLTRHQLTSLGFNNLVKE